jgi:ABC-type multidrug transport system fused ATPase/permease subunit
MTMLGPPRRPVRRTLAKATSALDSATEREVQQALLQLGQ